MSDQTKIKPSIELTDEEKRAVDELCEKRGLTGRDLAELFLCALGVYTPNDNKPGIVSGREKVSA